MPSPRSSRAPRPSVAAVQAEEVMSRLEAVAAELQARGWTAHVAATPPYRPPQLFTQDTGNLAARGHILAAPDDTTGEWWYWDDAQRPIAAASKPGAAADRIMDALSGPGRSGGDTLRERPTTSRTSPGHRAPGAPSLVNRPTPGEPRSAERPGGRIDYVAPRTRPCSSKPARPGAGGVAVNPGEKSARPRPDQAPDAAAQVEFAANSESGGADDDLPVRRPG